MYEVACGLQNLAAGFESLSPCQTQAGQARGIVPSTAPRLIMTEPFYRAIGLDGWTITVASSDTIDLLIEGGPMPFSVYLNADQAEELIQALQSALEHL